MKKILFAVAALLLILFDGCAAEKTFADESSGIVSVCTAVDTDAGIYEEDFVVKGFAVDNCIGLPRIDIDTRGVAIVSKENYTSCTVSITNAGRYSIDSVSGQIRLRGNSTYNLDKKPFRLKFDKKIDLFGFGEDKDWVLLANYADPCMMRNFLAYTIASSCLDDIKYTTDVQFADVYLNGDYYGVFLLTEQVETGKNRVNICEDTNELQTSYLIELDYHVYDAGASDKYFTVGSVPYVIKFPDAEKDINYAKHERLIKRYLEKIWKCFENNADFEVISDYIDVDTFADSYIMHELFHTLDSGYSSFYMYKDADGKLCSGPLWDFDVTIGNCSWNEDMRNRDELFAYTSSPWYNRLLKYDEFRMLVLNKLDKYYDRILYVTDITLNTAYENKPLLLKDDERWHTFGRVLWPQPRQIALLKTWDGHTEYIRQWIYDELDIMKNKLSFPLK